MIINTVSLNIQGTTGDAGAQGLTGSQGVTGLVGNRGLFGQRNATNGVHCLMPPYNGKSYNQMTFYSNLICLNGSILNF